MLESIPAIRDRIPNRIRKYLTLFGSMLIEMSLYVFFTYGNMSPYVISYLREKTGSSVRYTDMIFLDTTYSLLNSIASVLTGIMTQKFNLNIRIIILISCLIYNVSNSLCFFSIQYSFWLTLITYSVINGAASGVCYILPLQYAIDWFPDRKGMANSAILFGYGLSATVFSQIQTRYINPENLSPDRFFNDDNSTTEKYFSQEEFLDRVPSAYLILGAISLAMQLTGWSLIFVAPKQSDIKMEEKNEKTLPTFAIDEKSANRTNSLGVDMSNRNSGLKLKEVIKLPAYYQLNVMFILAGLAPSFSIAFYKIFGQTFLNDDLFLTTINTFSAICNAFGRFFWGFMIDRFSYKFCYISLNSGLLVLIGTLYIHSIIKIKYLYMLWICVIYGVQCGSYIITPTVIANMFGPKEFTAIYPSITLIQNVTAMLIKISLGQMQETIGWLALFSIAAGFALLGIIIAIFFRVKNANGRNI